jgi:uncharacterized membrane protein
VTKFLLSVHVLAAIVAIGPVTVAASMFPPAARAALTRPGDAQAAGVVRTLYRICGVYSALGLVVVVFGFFTAQSLGVLGQGWLMAAIALTALAALVLAFAVLPIERDLMDAISAALAPTDAAPAATGDAALAPAGDAPRAAAGDAALAPAGDASPASAGDVTYAPAAGTVPAQPTEAPALATTETTMEATTVGTAAAIARSRRLAMTVGMFNLLWVAVTVLMIVRPGSTTGA